MSERFDASYYAEFYGRRPVHTRARIAKLAAGVFGICGWLDLPVRSVLDVGAGPGYWGDYIAASNPKVRYRGIDVSAFACRRYGHEQRDITAWRPSRPVDLCVCQGVLQYLDDEGVAAAVGNLATATRAALYLEVPTSYDRVATIDPDHTDLDVHWRSGGWYANLLEPHFERLGAGLWIARSSRLPLYELERAEPLDEAAGPDDRS